MQDRKKRGPFLQEDVDHLIRDETRRYPRHVVGIGRRSRVSRSKFCSKKVLGTKIRAWFAVFLNSGFECICED